MLSFVSRSVRRLAGPPADASAGAPAGTPSGTGAVGAVDPGLERLLQRLARGDTGALDLLYRREADAVYRFTLALCGNPAWAADATQDAFLALAVRPAAYDAARGSLGAYLAGAARHALLAQWRHARRYEPWADDETDVGVADQAEVSPETLLVRAQDLARFWDALRSLPWPFREALVLVDLQDRPYAEAAAIAGINLNTLRTRLHRGRLKLAQVLNADEGGHR